MFFTSVKEANRLRKEINKLLSKGMSNIYFKVIIEKNSKTFSKRRFSKFKTFVTGHFWEAPTHADINEV